MLNKLNLNGSFGKMFVVKYGWKNEQPKFRKFITIEATKIFVNDNFAIVQDVSIEYTQKHSIYAELMHNCCGTGMNEKHAINCENR